MAIALSELLPNASIEISYSPSNQEGETIHHHYHCVPIVFIGLANWTPRLDGNPHAVGNRSANHTLKRSASPQTWTIVRHLASGRLTYDWPAMREPTIGRHREFRHAKGGAWTATDRLCGAERSAAQSNSRRVNCAAVRLQSGATATDGYVHASVRGNGKCARPRIGQLTLDMLVGAQ